MRLVKAFFSAIRVFVYTFITTKNKIAITVIILLLTLSPAMAANYEVLGVGNLGNASIDESLYAFMDINDSAQIIGPSLNFPGGNGHDLLWDNGSITELGHLGGNLTAAHSINNLGQIAGASLTSDGTSHAFIWENNNLQILDDKSTEAWGINDSGQVVGFTVGSTLQAMLWENNSRIQLGNLGLNFSFATKINNSNQIIGASLISQSVQHAFLWENNVMHDLGTIGERGSSALDINDLGQVVGVSANLSSEYYAVLWENDTIMDLGHLGTQMSFAEGINNLGQVVGWSKNSELENRAFIYENGEMIDLNSKISSGSGWTLLQAKAINNNGQIVGFGEFNGQSQAFLLSPVAAPEPVSSTLMLIGGGAMILRRRYKFPKKRSTPA